VPLATQRTEAGELAAVCDTCRALTPRDTVLLVDPRARREWPQALRGICGVDSVSVPVDAVSSAVEAVRAGGRRPVLASTTPDPLVVAATGAAAPRLVASLRTREDERVLTERPDRTVALRTDLWIVTP
ncbi:MAG: hypothetical protein M3Q27_08025, partial [Actinomycetota bacterium]|nr:hypothetical protein [Actinomycetota bacterium]